MVPKTLTRSALLLLGLGACAAGPPPSAPHALLGKHASLSLPDLQGALTRLHDSSAAATIVDFWATDCRPCEKSLPRLAGKAHRLGTQGIRLRLVGVLREDESTDAAVRTLRSWGVVHDSLIDRGGAVQKQLGIRTLPATMVLDADGTMRWYSPCDATAEEIAAAAFSVARSRTDD